MLSPDESKEIFQEQQQEKLAESLATYLSLPKLVGVYSPARQHGKSTLASVLVEGFGYRIHKFAGPLYAMWTALCESAGLPGEITYRAAYGSLKETPLAQLAGLSFRSFAEGVGTQWGRKMVSDTLWVDIARQGFRAAVAKGQYLVVDDMRFPNEFNLINSLGGVTVAVVRPGGAKPSLPSEGHLLLEKFDVVFGNDGTIEDLRAKVRRWILKRTAAKLA